MTVYHLIYMMFIVRLPLLFALFLITTCPSKIILAAYANYNSVLIGQEASGLGGAYTSMTGDAAAVGFYNPAAMARMTDTTLSASVSTYQKIDTEYGKNSGLLNASTRINQGFFEPIPSATGSVISYGHFALGISVIIPDFTTFTGEIESTDTITSFINLKDQSLWVGGSFALNISQNTSIGFSTFYTARQFSRSISDQLKIGSNFKITAEEKAFTNNSIISILGLYHQLNKRLSFGASLRFPSIEVSGKGSFFQTNLDSATPSNNTEIKNNNINSETRVPLKAAIGVSYVQEKNFTLSLDITYHGAENYQDLDLAGAGDQIDHSGIFNIAAGGEYYIKPWLSNRIGFFTNYSSHIRPSNSPTNRTGDSVDMYGFSTNLNFHTSKNTVFTFGGYWTGGTGESIQQIGQELKLISKAQQIFSMIIGTSYNF